MARFHSVTWQDGNFENSASVLSFDSKKARAAFPSQCSQRVESINSKKMASLLRSGYPHRLVLWDESDPHNFRIAYVPSEALTYFLRRAHATGAKDEFKQLFGLLMKRVGQSLFASIPDSRMAGAQDIREEVMSRFAERIAKDCSGRFAMLDFFEVRFDLAFARFRKTVLRQIGPASVLTVPLSTDDDEGQDISPEVEAAAADFLGGDPQKIDDPAFRLELDAAIDALPDDQRRVVGLLRQGFQIDSKDPNIMTIAKMLQCDERTVRNRRDRAYKTLRSVLQEDA